MNGCKWGLSGCQDMFCRTVFLVFIFGVGFLLGFQASAEKWQIPAISSALTADSAPSVETVLPQTAPRKNGSELVSVEPPKIVIQHREEQKKPAETKSDGVSKVQDTHPEASAAKPKPVSVEKSISAAVFEHLAGVAGSEVLNPDAPGEARVIVLGWEECPACKALVEVIRKKKLPFRVQLNRVEFYSGDAKRRARQLGFSPEAAEGKAVIQGVIDSTFVLQKVTGMIRVPAFAWRLADGTCRFGIIPGSEALERIDKMVREQGVAPK